jgi:hypothetical protein
MVLLPHGLVVVSDLFHSSCLHRENIC